MTPRQLVAERLHTGLPKSWNVVGHARAIDHVSRHTVMVWTESISPAPDAAHTYLVRVGVWALSPLKTNSGELDDDLDDIAARVLGVLQKMPEVQVESAEWTTHESSGADGMRFTLTAAMTLD